MVKKKILIIEDEAAIQAILKNYLEDAGYDVAVASDGLEGFAKFQSEHYDLVMLDVMMPKIDGFVVLEMIRKESEVPVMMITAMGQDMDQMKAFDLEVDDYVVKPFTTALVLRRVSALLRRGQATLENRAEHVLKHRDLTLDTRSHEVFVLGKVIALTHKEFELLKVFLEHKNLVFSREVLLERLWGYDFYGNDKVVNVHIQNLRKKLGGDYIETVRGVGYKLAKEN